MSARGYAFHSVCPQLPFHHIITSYNHLQLTRYTSHPYCCLDESPVLGVSQLGLYTGTTPTGVNSLPTPITIHYTDIVNRTDLGIDVDTVSASDVCVDFHVDVVDVNAAYRYVTCHMV